MTTNTAPRFIVARIGCLADGKGTPACQVFERQPDGTYAVAGHFHFPNDPVRPEVALGRVADLVAFFARPV